MLKSGKRVHWLRQQTRYHVALWSRRRTTARSSARGKLAQPVGPLSEVKQAGGRNRLAQERKAASHLRSEGQINDRHRPVRLHLYPFHTK
jgi:hypothetical protein